MINNCYWNLYLKARSKNYNHDDAYNVVNQAYKSRWSPKQIYKCWHCGQPDCYRYCVPYCVNKHPLGQCSCTFEEVESYLRKEIIFE